MLCDVMRCGGDFTTFEHVGWERVADKYDSVWSLLTRQFIPAFARVGFWHASRRKLHAIRMAIENQMQRHAKGDEFVLPMTAHVVAVAKR